MTASSPDPVIGPGAAAPRRPIDSFLGRRREAATLRRLLKSERLITLFGPGGVGKSRLAVEVALDCAGRYPDGVVMVELGRLAAPELLAQTLAAALGVAERRGAGLTATIAAALDGRRVLLVLDNCEHLADGCARLAEGLLAGCRGPQALVTSREILQVPGEVAFRVDPLPLPPEGDDARETLLGSDAVRLFVERARSCEPDFELTPDNGAHIAAICRRLEGLPLAIELCASRVRLLGVDEILARLVDRFALLDLAPRTRPDRHRSLHAAIEWSYLLLTPAEQAAFRRLAVLAGGFDVGAASAVCGDPAASPAVMVNLLAGLESKSLIVPVRTASAARFRMLETVRLYGRDRLVEAGELRTCQERMVDWMHGVAMAVQHDSDWRRGNALAELANLQLATRWAEQWADERQVVLATVLAKVWQSSGYMRRGRELLRRVVATGIGRPADRATALSTLAWFAFYEADYACAARLSVEAIALAEPLDDTWAKARAYTSLGAARANLGDFAGAREMFTRCVEVWTAVNDPLRAASALQNLAYCQLEAGDAAEAAATLARAKAQIGEGHSDLNQTFLHTYGAFALRTGDERAAEAAFTDLVRAYAADIDHAEPPHLAYGLEGLAVVAVRQGAPDRALRLLGATAVLRERLHAHPEQQWRTEVAETVARARREADDPDGAWAEGAGWTPEQAVAYVCAEPPPKSGADDTALLSDRELEVVELIAQGKTNRQIASALGISSRTVETHADHIRSKLALRSRTEIAVWAAKRSG